MTAMLYPKLFKVSVPEVGVYDLLNFHKYTTGKGWTDEYGNPEEREDFLFLKDHSPYHIAAKKEYPGMLIMGANFDDRVKSFHSYKLAAKLQEKQLGEEKILLHMTQYAGHGRRNGSAKEYNRYLATKWTYLIQNLMDK